MKEGEPILGGPQANPGAANVPNPGTRPASSAVAQPVQPQTMQPSQPQFQPQRASSDASDVVLSISTPNSRNKKAPIIILILLLVVCVVAVCAYFFIPNQTDNTIQESSHILAQDFNLYANNLLFGEEKTDPVVDFDINELYYIDENYGDTDYLKSLLASYNKFLAQAESSGDEEIRNIPLQETKDQLEFLTLYDEQGFIEDATILNAYYSDGPAAAESIVKEYYSVKDDDPESLKILKEYSTQIAFTKIKILNNEEPSDTIENIMNKIYDMVVSSTHSLKDSCKKISLAINGGNNE